LYGGLAGRIRERIWILAITLLVDADDTLWENNIYFIEVTERFLEEMEGRGIDRETARVHLNDTERRNIPLHGYGSTAFAHSLLEAFQALIPDDDSQTAESLVSRARAIHDRDEMELLPGVQIALEHLSRVATLILVTKGRPEEQSPKIERSGLSSYFAHVEIVPEKSEDTYRDIVRRHGLDPVRYQSGPARGTERRTSSAPEDLGARDRGRRCQSRAAGNRGQLRRVNRHLLRRIRRAAGKLTRRAIAGDIGPQILALLLGEQDAAA
jgi:putative hydrolase of the HAD superfamily